MSNLLNCLPLPRYGLIGHRGAAGLAPENTLASFKKAATLGLNWVEFDVRLCGSGEWVVIHDETLERTTNGHGLVSQTPYETLKTLDAGSWFDPQFENVRIPLLSQTLSFLATLNLHPNIEIKTFTHHKKEKMEHFIEQLHHWPASLPLPLVSSFDLEILIILRSLHSDLPLGYLVDVISDCSIQQTIQCDLNALHAYDGGAVHTSTLPLDKIPILIYTVNNQKRIEYFLQMGIHAIFSDLTDFIPASLLKV